jgi:hypothetical protein
MPLPLLACVHTYLLAHHETNKPRTAESANSTDGPAKNQTDVVFDDDNIDFNLGATPNVVQDELETAEESKEPFSEAFAPLSRASSTIDNGTQAPDDELELHFDDEATAPIAGDSDGDDLLDEIDWRDPDPATQGEEDESPPSATKRSRPEDGTDAGEHGKIIRPKIAR